MIIGRRMSSHTDGYLRRVARGNHPNAHLRGRSLTVNNLAFMSQDAATVGPKVEEKVREEVGGSTPIPYQVEMGEAGTATLGSVLGDIAGALTGGKNENLFWLTF